MKPLAVVWLKRDLRLSDHEPMLRACKWAREVDARVVLMYLIEPELLNQPDSSPQHYNFALECIAELASDLPNDSGVLLIKGEASTIFDVLCDVCPSLEVFSYQETGNWASYQRDLRVASVLSKRGVRWQQYQQNAVVRGKLNRDKWSDLWLRVMSEEIADSLEELKRVYPISSFEFDIISQALHTHHLVFSWLHEGSDLPAWSCHTKVFEKAQRDKAIRQRGGRRLAHATLDSFLRDRGRDYRREMSSPLTAESACSRISPYLTFGVISIREVLRCLNDKRLSLSELAEPEQKAWRLSLKSFESRLHWHCHFIQKLESEPELEMHAVHRGLDKMRSRVASDPEAKQRLIAWIEGRTGFPMIDACMRMLRKTGWVNFRMRAMLVAFASYQLWLDWRDTAPLLAREFLDYEPGIHYPQFQMQSGVTGINTLRIYNPTKQAHDHDPKGLFITYWIPEIKNLPLPWIFEPWKTPKLIQEDVGVTIGQDYPEPIVDPDTAIAQARGRISAFRKAEGFDQEARRVYQKHGSRNPNRNGTASVSGKKTRRSESGETAPCADKQMGLFD